MKIFYNMTGPERKALVAAVSQILGTPAQYLKTPTYSFQIGDYNIGRIGTLTGKDNLELEDALNQQGFSADEREYDEPDTYESGLGGLGAAPSAEELGHTDVGCQDEPESLTIELPLEGCTEENIANLEKLVASKAGLIKKALGIDALPIERTETTLRFPWFALGTPGDDVDAYTRFIGALYATAKKQQRVTAKEHLVENEKFAFRVFLIRLGFVGDEYKAARKTLLRNLSGNSAFKVVPKSEEVDDHE